MKKYFAQLGVVFSVVVCGCTGTSQKLNEDANNAFSGFKDRFLDAYWKQHPNYSIIVGYGKFYEDLVIPSQESIEKDIVFAKRWLDSLDKIDLSPLSNNNKISHGIIKNQLEGDVWYQSVFKQQEWDATLYNISGQCDYILNQPYAPLDKRLSILSQHLEYADEYYKGALAVLNQPTREHVNLAILQNQGGLSFFETAISDSIKASHLSDADKLRLQQNITKTITAIQTYIQGLKAMLADKNYAFRSFRIGKDLFTDKFKYDLVTDFTPSEIYTKAMLDKKTYQQKMAKLASDIWRKYYGEEEKPKDSIRMIQMIMERIQLQHAAPKDFYDTLTNHVFRLKRFIIEKNLFDFDTSSTQIKVRYMPEYLRGLTVANAEFTPPYQKQGTTYYNIDDLTLYPPEKSEGTLREYNNYSSQLLSMHEAVPGHCVQSIYNKNNSPDVVRSVFENGTMIEGWAVYAVDMMVENGWGDGAPEMELTLYKSKLTQIANVLLDYDIHCLNAPKDSIMKLLTQECFQTRAQAEEKYHRATVTQVQLCSYYTGGSAIHALREAYRKKRGNQYSLKDFHEKFLSLGSSPVQFIRERMLE